MAGAHECSGMGRGWPRGTSNNSETIKLNVGPGGGWPTFAFLQRWGPLKVGSIADDSAGVPELKSLVTAATGRDLTVGHIRRDPVIAAYAVHAFFHAPHLR